MLMVGVVLSNNCALCTGDCSSVPFLVLQGTILQHDVFADREFSDL